ncbi:hypothetical protein [Gaetbulibacter sp. PBL-D1]|uniref:hypothetical protein n=1 Tax=Gaetbulibacter sp. PBL-D1 TaxID=3422594 RepID=UPI003D2F393A
MAKVDLQSKFDIGDTVWLNISDGEELVVVNIIYNFLAKWFEYQTMTNTGDKNWYNEREIVDEKPTIRL